MKFSIGNGGKAIFSIGKSMERGVFRVYRVCIGNSSIGNRGVVWIRGRGCGLKCIGFTPCGELVENGEESYISLCENCEKKRRTRDYMVEIKDIIICCVFATIFAIVGTLIAWGFNIW